MADFAHLSSGLVQAKVMPQLLLADSSRSVNLVSKNEEGNLREFLNGQESVEFRLGLGEALKVGTVDEKDNAIDFREVVTPETAS